MASRELGAGKRKGMERNKNTREKANLKKGKSMRKVGRREEEKLMTEAGFGISNLNVCSWQRQGCRRRAGP